MSVTRVLGIAPYESMCALMQQAAENIPGITLTAFAGNLEAGAQIAARYTEQDFDVILSRGGTAEHIRRHTPLPVVEIELTPYDILRAIRLAQGSGSRYAVVGFPAITRKALILGDIMRYPIDLYPIHNEQEARSVLETLARESCPTVLCDMITHSLAQEYNLPAILITSGLKSVEEALERAIDINGIFQPHRDRLRMAEALLSAQTEEMLVYDENGEKMFSSLRGSLPDVVEKRAFSCAQAALREGKKRADIAASGRAYYLHAQAVSAGQKRYSFVRISSGKGRAPFEKRGIRLLNKEEIRDDLSSVFFESVQTLIPMAAQNKKDGVLLLTGNMEADTDSIARLLYAKSDYQNAPLYEIDCALLQEKGWSYLTESNRSPLMDTGITLYFRHIADLSDAQFQRLSLILYDMQLERRNCLMFDCSSGAQQSAPPPRCQQLLSRFRGEIVSLSPLKEKTQEISHLAGMYISVLNLRCGKEIVGLEPNALRLLEEYDWPQGYEQLRRVLDRLVEAAESAYLLERDTRQALADEKRLYSGKSSLSFTDTIRGKSLAEIERLAIQWALEEHKGNQSAAARQLGISRTTLWRMLQTNGDAEALKNSIV